MRPSTTSPSRDYVLCYLAKETDGAGLTALLRTGLPIRLFGAKTASWVSGVLRHHPFPNAQVLGRVSEEKLRDLYTNALVTAFPFTEESFGLVPVESMACGTPVLTYRAQGPGETVLDGRTGWLVRTPEELAECASRIFRDGYGGEMVRACLARSAEFSLDAAYSHWDQLLSSIASGRVVPASPSASPQRDARSRALTLPAGRGQRVEGQRFATGSVKPPYNSS
jgi:glycosyltransferase involved in cell wall biosynthesis